MTSRAIVTDARLTGGRPRRLLRPERARLAEVLAAYADASPWAVAAELARGSVPQVSRGATRWCAPDFRTVRTQWTGGVASVAELVEVLVARGLLPDGWPREAPRGFYTPCCNCSGDGYLDVEFRDRRACGWNEDPARDEHVVALAADLDSALAVEEIARQTAAAMSASYDPTSLVDPERVLWRFVDGAAVQTKRAAEDAALAAGLIQIQARFDVLDRGYAIDVLGDRLWITCPLFAGED